MAFISALRMYPTKRNNRYRARARNPRSRLWNPTPHKGFNEMTGQATNAYNTAKPYYDTGKAVYDTVKFAAPIVMSML